jgi:hypothetical protein
MNVLEKILKEIEDVRKIMKSTVATNCFGKECENDDCTVCVCERVIEIIRSHMNDATDTNVPSNWIPVEERLPEAGELVRVTVHSSEWISDYNSDWVSEEDKIHYPAEYNVYDGFLCRDEAWIFYDKYNAEVTCVKEFGIDKGRVYDVVTAWMPIILPEPYKGGKENE